MAVQVKEFFDPSTSTLTYLVWQGSDAVLIDPVLDYEPLASKIATTSAEKIETVITSLGLNLHYILETHIHADHFSAACYFKEKYPQAQLAISSRVKEVQQYFAKVYALGHDFCSDGSQFDRLVQDGDRLIAGSLLVEILATPGHTPACVAYVVAGTEVFTGDCLFMPDSGTGRCDFPGGSAVELYQSVRRLYALGDEVRAYVGHDYQPGGRPLRFVATIGEHKKEQIHIKETTSQDEYVEFRRERDKTLAPPKLLLAAMQVNINAGKVPAYLKIPVVKVADA